MTKSWIKMKSENKKIKSQFKILIKTIIVFYVESGGKIYWVMSYLTTFFF